MDKPSAIPQRPIVLPSTSKTYNKKKREMAEYEERRRVTSETVEKKGELLKEGITVRDFALEAIEKEKAEQAERN